MKERMMRKLEQSYQYYMGNRSVRRSRIVCIGERHPYVIEFGKKVRLTNGTREVVDQLLARLVRRGDIVLIERHASGVQADQHVLTQLEHKIASDIAVYGWDDMGLRRKALNLEDQSLLADIEEQKSHAGFLREFRQRRGDQLHKKAYAVAMQRNASLQTTIEAMEKKLRWGRKLFVIAGNDHFIQDANFHIWLRKKRYKFSILTPK